MKLIFNKEVFLIRENNKIYLEVDVKLSNDYKSFNNFDIGDFKDKVDNLFDKISTDFIKQLDDKYPLYIMLSTVIFKELTEVQQIKYETKDMISIVERKDLILL